MNTQFAKDVLEGLSAPQKFLSSKYFYDKKGDEIFQQIMEMPEYYLTNCEFDIFSKQKDKILSMIYGGGIVDQNEKFQLIEFGAGDGTKTKILLEYFLEQKAKFVYSPIDISENVLNVLKEDLVATFPQLEVQYINNEYFQALKTVQEKPEFRNLTRKVILFLGANIGNFHHEQAVSFLKELSRYMQPQDLLLVGFDLKKNPQQILDAYNDKQGITRDFNLNVLRRINQELGGNFDLDKFIHSPYYNPQTGETKSYLVSKENQSIHIEKLGETFKLEAWESIYTELSKKYSLSDIQKLANESGFEVEGNLLDSNGYFTDSIWKIK